MKTPQTAVLTDHAQHGIWLTGNIVARENIQAACKNAWQAYEQIRKTFADDELGLSVAFGAAFWQSTAHAAEAPELKVFPSYGRGEHFAPATQYDILVHIQSLHQDSCFTLAQAVVAAFGESVAMTSETHGFRRHQARGLDGFVDGTENPQDEQIASVALNEHAGSYILFQHYEHNLQKWHSHSIAEQEEAVARSKISNVEFPKSERHPCSHIARTNLREEGVKLKIVRRSLPYGMVTGESGLAFMGYCGRLRNLEVQLQHMFGDAADGLTDLLLSRLSQARSGGYYYAPSVERLHDLGI